MALTGLKSIGKEMEKKLNEIGVYTQEDLIEIGSKEAFFRIKELHPEVCLVHLYTLEGAATDTEYNMLSEETKKDLKAFSDLFK